VLPFTSNTSWLHAGKGSQNQGAALPPCIMTACQITNQSQGAGTSWPVDLRRNPASTPREYIRNFWCNLQCCRTVLTKADALSQQIHLPQALTAALYQHMMMLCPNKATSKAPPPSMCCCTVPTDPPPEHQCHSLEIQATLPNGHTFGARSKQPKLGHGTHVACLGSVWVYL